MFRWTTMAGLLTTIFHLLLISLVAVSHAATTPEEYWYLILPNTPIPNAIKDILNTGERQNLHVDDGEYRKYFIDKNVNYNYRFRYGPPRASSAGDNMEVLRPHSDPSISLYFKEEDLLRPGAKMNFVFPRINYGVTFLSRQSAESIPFSSARLSVIFSRFSIEPTSALAKYVTDSLIKCDLPEEEGETKFCATSLESMVDFSTSILGTNQVEAHSTVVISKEDMEKPELFSVTGTRRLGGEKSVTCHEAVYPYAVFYCHTFPSRAYVAELAGEEGTRVEAAVACHTDTKAWSPDHEAFEMLKVKPGQATICHFLPRNDLIFSRNI